MTQPDDAWIEKMSELLKEHQRALTMLDSWERKRAAVAQQIDEYRNNTTIQELTEPAQVQDPA